jgi:hypothetical protein
VRLFLERIPVEASCVLLHALEQTGHALWKIYTVYIWPLMIFTGSFEIEKKQNVFIYDAPDAA